MSLTYQSTNDIDTTSCHYLPIPILFLFLLLSTLFLILLCHHIPSTNSQDFQIFLFLLHFPLLNSLNHLLLAPISVKKKLFNSLLSLFFITIIINIALIIIVIIRKQTKKTKIKIKAKKKSKQKIRTHRVTPLVPPLAKKK